LHFSHIGLTDGRTFMIPFELNDPDGEALEAGTAAATIPRSGFRCTPVARWPERDRGV
jgi:hypothetical protein